MEDIDASRQEDDGPVRVKNRSIGYGFTPAPSPARAPSGSIFRTFRDEDTAKRQPARLMRQNAGLPSLALILICAGRVAIAKRLHIRRRETGEREGEQ